MRGVLTVLLFCCPQKLAWVGDRTVPGAYMNTALANEILEAYSHGPSAFTEALDSVHLFAAGDLRQFIQGARALLA